MNPTLFVSQRCARLASVGVVLFHGITSFAAPDGPAPQIPEGASAPGAFPNGSVSAVNIIAKGSPEAFDSRVEVTGYEGQGPIPWSVNRYNRGDFSVRLAPSDPTAAQASLNLGFIEYAETSAGLAVNQAWRPHPALGVVIPTARQNGPIDWGDGTDPFYPTIAISQSSSGPGYNMVNGSFGTGELDINTGRAGVGPNGEGNFAFSVTWFPFDQGWIGGEFGNPGPAGEGVWRQPTSHATGVTEGMLKWIENPAGSGTFGGSAILRLPAVNSLTDGMLFASSSEGSSTLNIVGVAPVDEGAGWHITIREDEAADAETLAVPAQSPFQWVYVPWSTERLLGGYISGGDASKLASKGDFSIARSSEGVYELTVPGKTAMMGTLILQPAALEPDTSVPLATRAFLSYEWSGEKMVIKSFVTTGDVTVAPRDVDFYFAWIDFATPLAPASGVRLRNLPAAQVTPSEVEGVAAVFKEACVAINTDEPEILVTTIDERNVGGHIDPITGEVATSALVGYFYNPVTLTQTRGPFVILGNPSGLLNRHDAKYNPVSKQYVVVANARTYSGANGRAIPLIALVNPASVAGEASPVAKAFFYRETTETDFDDVSVAVSTKNGNFLLGAELKITGEGEGTIGALFDKAGNLLTPEYARLDRLQPTGDEDDPDVVYLPKKDVFLYVVNTDLTGGLANRLVGSVIQTVPNPAGELQVIDEQVIGDAVPAGAAEGHPASLENPLSGQLITAYDLGGNSVAAGDLAFTSIGESPSYVFTPARPETAYLAGSGGDPFQHNHPQLDVDPVHGVVLVGMAAYGSSQANPTAYTVQAFNLAGDLLSAPYAAPFFVADAPGGNSGSANYQNLKYSPQSGSFIAIYNNGTAATFVTSVSVTSDHLATPPAPSLAVGRSGLNVAITWPAAAAGFILESTDSLSAVSWTAVGVAVTEEGALKKVEVPAAGAAKFYRLKK